MTARRKLLNVGGNNKTIRIPDWYRDYEHLILDIDARAKPDILCDARNMLTLAPAQFDAILCSHNLEHYFAHEVPLVLAGFRHVLKSDGFVEIRVPDLDEVMRTYVERKLDIEDVLYQSVSGPISVRDVLFGYGKEIEKTGLDFYAHKTGFTWKALQLALGKANFPLVARKPGRGFELAALGFLSQPSDELKNLLGVHDA